MGRGASQKGNLCASFNYVTSPIWLSIYAGLVAQSLQSEAYLERRLRKWWKFCTKNV